MDFHEDRQREVDRQFGSHEQRRRFHAPPLDENTALTALRFDSLVNVSDKFGITLAEFMEAEDERERACHAIERNLDRNGIPEPQPTRYQWPTT